MQRSASVQSVCCRLGRISWSNSEGFVSASETLGSSTIAL